MLVKKINDECGIIVRGTFSETCEKYYQEASIEKLYYFTDQKLDKICIVSLVRNIISKLMNSHCVNKVIHLKDYFDKILETFLAEFIVTEKKLKYDCWKNPMTTSVRLFGAAQGIAGISCTLYMNSLQHFSITGQASIASQCDLNQSHLPAFTRLLNEFHFPHCERKRRMDALNRLT